MDKGASHLVNVVEVQYADQGASYLVNVVA